MAPAVLQPSSVPEVWWPLPGDSSCSGCTDQLLANRLTSSMVQHQGVGISPNNVSALLLGVLLPAPMFLSASLAQSLQDDSKGAVACQLPRHCKALGGLALPLHSRRCQQCCTAYTCDAAFLHEGQTHAAPCQHTRRAQASKTSPVATESCAACPSQQPSFM